MKLFIYSTAAALLASAGAATAAKSSQAQGNQPEEQLGQALDDMVTNASGNGSSPPGQSTRPDDPDQGDDNASDQAIFEVCYKDTPAADRSAICDQGSPVSPQ